LIHLFEGPSRFHCPTKIIQNFSHQQPGSKALGKSSDTHRLITAGELAGSRNNFSAPSPSLQLANALVGSLRSSRSLS